MSEKNIRCGVYAGSFDPPTDGHIWMIRESAKLFDKVIVAIGTNPNKKSNYMFTLEERISMLTNIVKINEFKNVIVKTFENQYLVDFAVDEHATHLVRGIRNDTDYQYEKGMLYINRDLMEEYPKQVETIFLIPPVYVQNISSSMVKELIGYIDWESRVTRYVPDSVFKCIKKKVKENHISKEICDVTKISEMIKKRFPPKHIKKMSVQDEWKLGSD